MILTREALPEYFSSEADFKNFVTEWLTYAPDWFKVRPWRFVLSFFIELHNIVGNYAKNEETHRIENRLSVENCIPTYEQTISRIIS